MKKYLVLLLALVMVFGLHSRVLADDDDNFNVDGFYIDQDQRMSYKPLVKHIVTNDSVTAAQTGMLVLVDSGDTASRVTLPSAEAGLIFTVVDGTGGGFIVAPASGDQIFILTLAVDEGVVSPGAVGDAITLIATGDTVWYTYTMGGGTWLAGGQ